MGNIYYYNEALGIGAVILVLVIYLAVIGLSIASYVLQGIGLYDLAKKRQIANPWLAWIPVANLWVTGAVADYHAARRGIKRRWRWLLLGLAGLVIVGYVVMMVVMFSTIFALEFGGRDPSLTAIWGMVGGIFAAYIPMAVGALALMPCEYVCMYKIFEETLPEKAVKYLLLSVLVPLAYGICLIRCGRQPITAAEETPAIEAPAEGNGFIPQDPFAGLGENGDN